MQIVKSLAPKPCALDADEGWRHNLEAQGREQAKLFSEEAYAKRLQAVYQTVMDARKR